jgi:Domain of Unknown Function (DUF928)
MKRFLYLVTLALAVFTLAIFPNLTTLMPVKSAPILLSQNVKFTPPKVTAPGNRQPGTHRGTKCPKDLSITPLMPQPNTSSPLMPQPNTSDSKEPPKTGLTLSESPTLFAYVSPASTQVKFNLFKEIDSEKEEVVSETTFKVEKPGIIAVTLPTAGSDKKSLEIDNWYTWSFSVDCNPKDRNAGKNKFSVRGFVKRIAASPTLKNDLANPDPMARLIAYATHGIWYETVATLAEMRRKAPDDVKLTAEWTELLKSQKLDSVADRPLVQSF